MQTQIHAQLANQILAGKVSDGSQVLINLAADKAALTVSEISI
ncbi:MAG: hypothetical protein RL670_1136 [Actinomycetota bacterium]|jgi:hypothetical protein